MDFNDQNKREYERYSISFQAEVISLAGCANNLSETTTLKDISGGGARFVSKHSERYSIGQKVDLIIHLPGDSLLNAKMEGSGKVAWMCEIENGELSIGLCMDNLLAFERIVSDSDSV